MPAALADILRKAPLTPEQSVTSMRASIAGLGPKHKGAFLNHDGRRFKGW